METSVNFNNTLTAYSYKKDRELKFTYYVFKMLRNPMLVRMLSEFANGILKYNIPLKSLIRNTVFKIFCSGEDIGEAFATIHKLEKHKVKSVLDYVAEAEENQESFETNTKVILANIQKLGAEAGGNSVSIKFTGLEDQAFFREMNLAVLNGTLQSNLRYDRLMKRLNLICEAALKNKVVLYFDAEDRFMQDIFDHIAGTLMAMYNQNEAIVYNTLQMYLTDRLNYLKKLIADSRLKQFYPGIKLVRGAYAEKEKTTAKAFGVPSPVYATKTQTDAAFNEALDICLKNHEFVYTCVASHNENSTNLALKLIAENNIVDHFKKVKFSQLYGMRDNLTFNLAAMGFNASKYLPYGEIKKAIPYLIRRAEENSSIGPQLAEEISRLENELKRRKLNSKTSFTKSQPA